MKGCNVCSVRDCLRVDNTMDGSNDPLLAAIDYDATSNSETQMPFRSPETGAAPSPFLPPGKIYHVFFSHCREDRDWVANMVDKLESAEYGFKCCFADRDFDLGVPVFQNITKCIHASKRTVIVLSPEFLESPWCSYETRITLELDLDTRQRLLIPVMLRNCEVPNFIGRLTYMEVENEHFWDRFVAAIRDDETPMYSTQETVGSTAIIAGDPFHFNPNFNNTEKIVEIPIYSDTGNCCRTSVIADLVPDELMRQGLQVTPNEYRDIVRAISEVFYIKCYGCFNRAFFWVAIAVFSTSASFAFTILMICTHIGKSCLDNIGAIFMLILVASVAIIAAIVSIHHECKANAVRRLSKALEEANEIGRHRNLIVSLRHNGSCRCGDGRSIADIVFIYYDWRPCLVYMNRFLRDRNGHLDLVSEEETVDLLVRHATEYGSLLLKKRINMPSEQRHTRQGECLCQFVESLMVEGKTSCLNWVFRINFRHPWMHYNSL